MGRDEVIVLDTHVLVWATVQNSSLGRRSRSIVSRGLAAEEIAVSAVSFWEIALLISKGKMSALRPAAAQRQSILETGVVELPLTGEIALRAAELDGLPADPIDRFITATALTHGAVLMTADEALLRWRHTLRRQNARS